MCFIVRGNIFEEGGGSSVSVSQYLSYPTWDKGMHLQRQEKKQAKIPKVILFQCIWPIYCPTLNRRHNHGWIKVHYKTAARFGCSATLSHLSQSHLHCSATIHRLIPQHPNGTSPQPALYRHTLVWLWLQFEKKKTETINFWITFKLKLTQFNGYTFRIISVFNMYVLSSIRPVRPLR